MYASIRSSSSPSTHISRHDVVQGSRIYHSRPCIQPLQQLCVLRPKSATIYFNCYTHCMNPKNKSAPSPFVFLDDLSSGSDSDYTKYWIDWFLNTKGNEYFCEVDEEYILDRFNLTGLNAEVQHYSQALDLITDNLVEEEFDEDMRDQVEKSARHLYGLIHARFVITSRGLAKMLDKYKKAEFGRCPRVLCHNQPLLPVGLSDVPHSKTVKLYCPKCEDIYSPKSSRHAAIDGAYYGTSFPHMLFQVYPNLMPQKSTERYIPRIFGFKVHEIAKVHRWQDQLKERLDDQTRQNMKEQLQ